ncbi:MAG: electron transfer flavoprotein subunit alpha/FixB family protein [Balneolaceae bacterium]
MKRLLATLHSPDNKINRASRELLSRCRQLADQHGRNFSLLLLGPDPGQLVEELKQYGPEAIYLMDDPVFSRHLNAPLVEAYLQAFKQIDPGVIVFPSNERTKDLLGALATRCDAPALPDLSQFELTEQGVTGKRPVMASKAVTSVAAEGAPLLLSLRAGSYEEAVSPSDPVVEEIPFKHENRAWKPTLREVIQAAAGQKDLTDADIIVAAGRGVKDEEGRTLISELADLLHAGIGASRALTESGEYDPSLQIGQTGKVVSPLLYIAIGISGAIQHVAGMVNSKVIVAINKDPDAPIFDIADYGIVGDLYQVLPPFIEEIRNLKEA